MDRVRVLATALVALRARVRALEAQEMPIMTSTENVSDPPTQAELSEIFGTPVQVGDGFVGLVLDGVQGSKAWVAFTINGVWWYRQLFAGTEGTVNDASESHDLNAVFDDTEVEAALDALGAKVNEILDALEAAGILV